MARRTDQLTQSRTLGASPARVRPPRGVGSRRLVVVTRLRCGPLAAWAAAWLNGTAAFDDVLTAVTIGASAPALAMAVPSAGPASASPAADIGRVSALGEVLIAWRQARADVRLVLPVAGDTRGVPGPASFRMAALDAGQAVVGAGAGGRIGVVPVVIDHHPSSAPSTLTWRCFEIDEPVTDHIALADAQYELTEAIRECASTLARVARDPADLAGSDLNSELIAARRAGERINLPPGFPPKAVALVAQAERMAAVLTLAGATGAAHPDGRTDALAPLVLAVRRARLAGYNAANQPAR